MKNLTRSTIAVGIALVAVATASAGPAFAGRGGTSIYSSGSKEAAYAAFRDDVEKISAQDVLADGHSAVTVYVIEGESQATLWDHNGASSTPEVRTISRPEGKSIRFKACIGEYSNRSIIACANWTYGVF